MNEAAWNTELIETIMRRENIPSYREFARIIDQPKTKVIDSLNRNKPHLEVARAIRRTFGTPLDRLIP